MSRPRLLDLFCGAGGAAMGYHRAGFDVVGVDIRPQPRFPFTAYLADALEFVPRLLDGPLVVAYDLFGETWEDLERFDAIHASPPCQKWTIGQNARKNADAHDDLITPLRPLLDASGLPYIIENVLGAPLIQPARVCLSRELRHDGFELRRHRYFETNWDCCSTKCLCGELPAAPVFGHSAGRDFRRRHNRDFNAEQKRMIMETPWMTRDETSEAIPPAFSEFIGHQLLQHLEAAVA